jgi:hypothetical protein
LLVDRLYQRGQRGGRWPGQLVKGFLQDRAAAASAAGVWRADVGATGNQERSGQRDEGDHCNSKQLVRGRG